MSIEKRISNLSLLSQKLDEQNEDYKRVIQKAQNHNRWFTKENIRYSSKQLIGNFLDVAKLKEWVSEYDLIGVDRKTVGLVLSGNIPFVGLHDLMCSYISGHKTLVKLSSKDKILMKHIIDSLYEIDSTVKNDIEYVERLTDFDAVIATGSNNSARYFNAYFDKYPNIIRHNRNSVAVLTGSETDAELLALGDDMFRYFGLGCRNITKLFLPENYDIPAFIEILQEYSAYRDHHKFKNNYDYQLSIHLLNQIKHFDGGFFIFRENEFILSPISVFNYSYYTDIEMVKSELKEKTNEIQCIVGKENGLIPFGSAQSPALNDYADNRDTMKFLVSL